MPADLMPLLHARDAAESKVAAIGTVNPRRGGPLNSLVQWTKGMVARALEWHIREQVEFNRGVMRCVQATLEALTESNRSMAALAAEMHQLREALGVEIRTEVQEMKDVRAHWAQWREGFEDQRVKSEIHLLRSVSELQNAFQLRVTLLDQHFSDLVSLQHGQLTAALDRNTLEVQERLWKDLQKVRGEYERLIYSELKIIRQRASVLPAAAPSKPVTLAAEPIAPRIDWLRFAERFRGSEERIRKTHEARVPRFAGAPSVLDLGCGRGEFLEAARDGGLNAHGIELNDECVALCRQKGLEVEKADMFPYLTSLPDASLGGVHCSQVIEHLAPDHLPELIRLLAQKMKPGALAVFETPNPECLAIFATHFYIDPTHTRPVPLPLLAFYLEEAGFAAIEVERVEPAADSFPSLHELPEGVRETFFGGLDYVLFARKF